MASPDVQLSEYEIGETGDHTAELHAWITDKKPRAIIALGLAAARAAQSAKTSLPVYVGATVLPPDGKALAGISRQIDPGLVIAQLRKLNSPVRRLYFVHRPLAPVLLEPYEAAARAANVQLETVEVDSALEAVTRINRVLGKVTGAEDVLWLGEGVSPLNPGLILSLVQDALWDKHTTVISDDPSDVQEGVLLAVYPDYKAMGETLRQMALGGNDAGVRLDRDVKVALNYRAARHLGLSFRPEDLATFAPVFGR